MTNKANENNAKGKELGQCSIEKKSSKARKSKTDKELWTRIAKEVTAYAKGGSLAQIGRDNGVSAEQVSNDIKKYWMVEQALDKAGVKKEILSLEQIRKQAFKTLDTYLPKESKAGIMKIIIDASKEIAILRGSRDVDGSNKTFIGGSLEDLLKKHREKKAKC